MSAEETPAPRGRPSGRTPKTPDGSPAHWSSERARWEVQDSQGKSHYRQSGDADWTPEDEPAEVDPERAEALRKELLPNLDVLELHTAEALRNMCKARGIRVYSQWRTKWSERQARDSFLSKLLDGLKLRQTSVDALKGQASATSAAAVTSSGSSKAAVTATGPDSPAFPAAAPAAAQTAAAPVAAPVVAAPEVAPEAAAPEAVAPASERVEAVPAPSPAVASLASRIEALSLEQLEAIRLTVCTFERQNERLREEEALRDEAEQSLREAVRELEGRLEEAVKKVRASEECKKAEGFMSRGQFASVLKRAGLLTQCEGAKHEGQHVFHIIASSNGGPGEPYSVIITHQPRVTQFSRVPDHVDNYLYALGGSFNIKIGEHLDHVNCFIAGKEKSRLAAVVALRVARDPKLHSNIEQRGGGKRTLITEGAHKDLCARYPNDNGTAMGEALYERGDREFSLSLRALSLEARGERYSCSISSSPFAAQHKREEEELALL